MTFWRQNIFCLTATADTGLDDLNQLEVICMMARRLPFHFTFVRTCAVDLRYDRDPFKQDALSSCSKILNGWTYSLGLLSAKVRQ